MIDLPGAPRVIRVQTLAGSDVAATVETWVQALVLSLPPDQLEQLLRFVASQPAPVIAPRPDPADPLEFLPKERR